MVRHLVEFLFCFKSVKAVASWLLTRLFGYIFKSKVLIISFSASEVWLPFSWGYVNVASRLQFCFSSELLTLDISQVALMENLQSGDVEIGYCTQTPCCHFAVASCWHDLVWLLKWVGYTVCVCLFFALKPKKSLTLFQPENLAQKLPNLVELWVCVGVLIYFYYADPSYLKIILECIACS